MSRTALAEAGLLEALLDGAMHARVGERRRLISFEMDKRAKAELDGGPGGDSPTSRLAPKKSFKLLPTFSAPSGRYDTSVTRKSALQPAPGSPVASPKEGGGEGGQAASGAEETEGGLVAPSEVDPGGLLRKAESSDLGSSPTGADFKKQGSTWTKLEQATVNLLDGATPPTVPSRADRAPSDLDLAESGGEATDAAAAVEAAEVGGAAAGAAADGGGAGAGGAGAGGGGADTTGEGTDEGTGDTEATPLADRAALEKMARRSSMGLATSAGGGGGAAKRPSNQITLFVQELDDLEVFRTLGCGSFGRVKLAVDRATHTVMALKILLKDTVVEMRQGGGGAARSL